MRWWNATQNKYSIWKLIDMLININTFHSIFNYTCYISHAMILYMFSWTWQQLFIHAYHSTFCFLLQNIIIYYDTDMSLCIKYVDVFYDNLLIQYSKYSIVRYNIYIIISYNIYIYIYIIILHKADI